MDAIQLCGSRAILAATNLAATANHYRDVLGFQIDWMYGEPPTFGCVRREGVSFFLTESPEVAQRSEGQSQWIDVADADALHAEHAARGAEIVEAVEDRPWGYREYVVRDLNGYRLRFAGPLKKVEARAAELPGWVTIEERLPTAAELNRLGESVGWKRDSMKADVVLARSLCGVVAIDTRSGDAIGTARVIGDETVLYVQDVIVAEPYQRMKIGAAIMQRVMTMLRGKYAAGTWVHLFASKSTFYEKFGFARSGMGMEMKL